MKRQVFLLILVSIIFFLSCSPHSNRTVEFKGKGLYVIDLDNATINREDVFLYSSLYKGIKTILLETNESCLIGNINKMRVFDQFIFILDTRIAKSLYVFDKDGRFIRKIGNVGGGPGEYVSPSDFTIDKDNKTIYVLDDRLQRIFKYDFTTGKFIHSVNLNHENVISNQIACIEGKLYADAYFHRHSDDNYLLRTIQEPSGKEESRYLNVMEYHKKFSNNASFFFRNKAFQFCENGNVVFVQPFMDHIMEITKDSIFPLVDLKSKDVLSSEEIKSALEKSPQVYSNDWNEIWKLKKYFQIASFIEHGNWFLIQLYQGVGRPEMLFNKQTNEVRFISRSWDDLLLKDRNSFYYVFDIGCYDANGVYYYYYGFRDGVSKIIELARTNALSPDLDKLEDLKKLKEEANPVIFYYEFKD